MGKYLLWFLAVSGAACWMALVVAVIWRRPITTWALRRVFDRAGVEVLELSVTSVGLYHAAAGPLDISWRGQRVHLTSVEIDRPNLVSPSLGRVAVKGLDIDLDLARLEKATAKKADTAVVAPVLPRFDALSVDGNVTVRAGGAGIPVALAFTAHPDVTGKVIHATVSLSEKSFAARANLDYDFARAMGQFALEDGRLDLAGSRDLLTPLLPEALNGWQVAGKVTVSASGSFASGRMRGKAELHLTDGAVANPGKHLSFEGVRADLVLEEPGKFVTPQGQRIVIAAARVGDVRLDDFAARYRMQGLHRIEIESASGGAFGGRISILPFTFDPSVVDYGLTVRVAGVQVADVMALFPSATASATGEADGEVTLHYGAEGLGFGRGWLGLHAGTTGTLLLQEPGLLTANLSTDSMAYSTLKEVENGLTNLRVTALRVDVHPVNAPAGRSVQIHVEGRPLDPNVKAPVTFDVNVNGPVEKLIQWGLDSQMNFSRK